MRRQSAKKKQNSDILLKNDQTILQELHTNVITELDKPDPFSKHLNYPDPMKKTDISIRAKVKLPSAITPVAWRRFYTQKEKQIKKKQMLRLEEKKKS